jgi:hypothetical protein
MMNKTLRQTLGDLRQFASVRRITLDDGPERGVRALAFSTGGGLDFWVLADRSLDIGPLWLKGRPLAWQSPTGFRSPALHDAEADGGRGFDRSFSGFLVTCGLDHIRQPASGQPMHGRLPFTPARLTAYGEDWDREEPVLFCEGEVIQARVGGEALRLTRRIEAPIGGTLLTLADRVENIGSATTPQASLYHFNLGYPAIAQGTVVTLDGKSLLGPIKLPDAALPPKAASHRVAEAEQASCRVTTPIESGVELATCFSFATATLPVLQLWHDLTPGVCVLGIEPCTSLRTPDGRSTQEALLKPGAARNYSIAIAFEEQPVAEQDGADQLAKSASKSASKPLSKSVPEPAAPVAAALEPAQPQRATPATTEAPRTGSRDKPPVPGRTGLLDRLSRALGSADRYRAEQHYMRGPGPKTRAKLEQQQNKDG